jgi:ubiquinone/menaquinone biosynthesis C-methylase UbiE
VSESRHKEKVRAFFDNEAVRYARQRYGDEDPGVAQPYLERTELVLEMLDADGKDVLDIGCGPGVLEPYLLDRGCRVIAVDFSSAMLAQARESLRGHPRSPSVAFSRASADALPFADASFDAFVCIGVLSYVPDTDRLLREVARVLKPSGIGIFQAQNVLSLWELEHRFVRVPYHWTMTILTGKDIRDADFPTRRFVPGRLDARIAKAGLRVEGFRFYDFYLPFLRRIAPRVDAWFSTAMRGHRRSRGLGHLGTGYLIQVRRV